MILIFPGALRSRSGEHWIRPPGQPAGFGEQEKANLRNVRAGGDVDQVVFRIVVERVGASEVEERLIDVLEVPWVAEIDLVKTHLGLGRNRRTTFAAHQVGESVDRGLHAAVRSASR